LRPRPPTGDVYEQAVELRDEHGVLLLSARRVTVELEKPTRDGDSQLHMLTSLPAEDADALAVAELYRGRWKIETAFGELAATLSAEIATLAYPKAALFCFCVGLAASNVLSVVKGALRATHGQAETEKVSAYYLADEIARTYDGMMIAIPEEHWLIFQEMTVAQFGGVLKDLAQRVRLERLRKHPRGPKKPVVKEPYDKKHPHVATARLLKKTKQTG
jgi:hypothetical protein